MRRSSSIRRATAQVLANARAPALDIAQDASARGAIKRALSIESSPRATGILQAKKIKLEFDNTIANIKSESPRARAHCSSSSSSVVKDEKQEDDDDIQATQWHDLSSVEELSCVVTLTSGQVFTWKRYADTDAWIGVIGENVFKLREQNQRVQFQLVHPPHVAIDQAYAVLYEYFRLEIDASVLYKGWSEKDDDMSRVIKSLPGLRIIQQDPVECLFAFICSSNNNIQRITQMVTKLKATYGEKLYHDLDTNETFYAFPTVDALVTQAEDHTLRELGFGYRAPFIIKSSKLLQTLGGPQYLLRLRQSLSNDGDSEGDTKSDEYAEKLMEFAGVGRKVADCVALFSLNMLHAIPVDTHVWQIACREFDASLQHKKSLTPTIYKAIGAHFRNRFSPYAGWAHSVLFTGDLASFQPHLPQNIQHQKKKNKMKKEKKD